MPYYTVSAIFPQPPVLQGTPVKKANSRRTAWLAGNCEKAYFND